MNYKNNYPFNQRKLNCNNILKKYPNRIPIICEKFQYSLNAPNIDKHKYLVAYDLTLGQFMAVIRKRMKMTPDAGLYIFINGIISSNSYLLSSLYSDFKDDDGFLYIIYDVESTFGSYYDFKNDDIIYLIQNSKIDYDNSYIIHNIEIIKGGNWHDGFSETHYAYLENIKTNIFEKKEVAYINMMCQVQNIYAIKC